MDADGNPLSLVLYWQKALVLSRWSEARPRCLLDYFTNPLARNAAFC
jgi:hypothetical protein